MIEEDSDGDLQTEFETILASEGTSRFLALMSFRRVGEREFEFLKEKFLNGNLPEQALALKMVKNLQWSRFLDFASLLPQILAFLEPQHEARLRTDAAFVLGRYMVNFPAEETLYILRGLLFDELVEIRLEVVNTFGELEDSQAIPLIACLLDDEERVSLAARHALEQIGSPYARVTLKAWMKNQPNSFVDSEGS